MIVTCFSSIVANKPTPNCRNVYSEEILSSIKVEPNTPIFLEAKTEDSKSWIKLKVGTIVDHKFNNEMMTNELTIDLNCDLKKLSNVSTLVPLGAGNTVYDFISTAYKIKNYEFFRFRFGAFWNIERMNQYFLNRKNFPVQEYLNSNNFK